MIKTLAEALGLLAAVVAAHHEPITNERLGVDAGDDVKEVDRASEPALRARRHVPNRID